MNARVSLVVPEFVEFIPERLAPGTIYISERYKTAVHLCCCGCGEEVVTPLGPADWRVQRVGQTVSLWPSIGNWKFTCRSHCVIRMNKVIWAGSMSPTQILAVEERDTRDKARHIAAVNAGKCSDGPAAPARTPVKAAWPIRLLRKVRSWFGLRDG